MLRTQVPSSGADPTSQGSTTVAAEQKIKIDSCFSLKKTGNQEDGYLGKCAHICAQGDDLSTRGLLRVPQHVFETIKLYSVYMASLETF